MQVRLKSWLCKWQEFALLRLPSLFKASLLPQSNSLVVSTRYRVAIRIFLNLSLSSLRCSQTDNQTLMTSKRAAWESWLHPLYLPPLHFSPEFFHFRWNNTFYLDLYELLHLQLLPYKLVFSGPLCGVEFSTEHCILSQNIFNTVYDMFIYIISSRIAKS